MSKMKNRIIKRALFEADMKQYHLAGLLGIREESLSRKMREELPEEEQKRIADIIRRHAEGKGKENTDSEGASAERMRNKRERDKKTEMSQCDRYVTQSKRIEKENDCVQNMTDKIKVCSMSELSRQTGVALYTIRKLVNDGRLPVLKIGNKYLVKVEDFKALFVAPETDITGRQS